jgi:hypothetical protein
MRRPRYNCNSYPNPSPNNDKILINSNMLNPASRGPARNRKDLLSDTIDVRVRVTNIMQELRNAVGTMLGLISMTRSSNGPMLVPVKNPNPHNIPIGNTQ